MSENTKPDPVDPDRVEPDSFDLDPIDQEADFPVDDSAGADFTEDDSSGADFTEDDSGEADFTEDDSSGADFTEDDTLPPAAPIPTFIETDVPATAAVEITVPDAVPDAAPRTGWREVLAFAAFTAIVVQLLGGVALSMHYVPSVDGAHASLLALEQDQKYGVSLRALHWLGASVVVGLVLFNLLVAFLASDHKKPGRAAWISGALILFVVLGFGITGELLPWTEQGVYATEVRTGLMAKAPSGDLLREAVLAGDAIAEPTLTRFHALHVLVLPALLIILIVWHRRSRRRIGRPRFVTLPQALAAVLVTAGLAYGARELQAPLGAVFVPGDAGFEAWPEWSFLWLNKLLKLFPPGLEAIPAFWIPNGLAALLLLIPFLDFRAERSWRRRPLAVLAAVAGVLVLAGLSVANHLERPVNEPALPYALEMNDAERAGYRLVRQQNCLECHQLTFDKVTYGEEKHDAPDLDDLDGEQPVEEFARIVQDAERELGTEEMPPFDHLPWESLRTIGIYLKHLNR